MQRFYIGGTQPEAPDDHPNSQVPSLETPLAETPLPEPEASQPRPEEAETPVIPSADDESSVGSDLEPVGGPGYLPGKKHEEPPEQPPKSAVDKRLRRIMTPTASGGTKVPQEWIDMWKDLSTRHKVMSMFEKAGYDPDWVGGKWNQNKSDSGLRCFHR